jgi:hypothetical protein
MYSQIESHTIENNMAKKVKTFADRAKEIKKKYSRADWDKLERDDMIKELRALRDEQEEERSAMGIAEYANKADEEESYPNGGEITNTPYVNRKNFADQSSVSNLSLMVNDYGSDFKYYDDILNGKRKNSTGYTEQEIKELRDRKFLIFNLYKEKLSEKPKLGNKRVDIDAISYPFGGNFDFLGNQAVDAIRATRFGDSQPNNPLQKSSMPTDNPYSGTQAPVNVNNAAWTPMQDSSLFNNATRSISSNRGPKFQLPQTSVLPTAISAGASILGDIIEMNYAKKHMPQSVNLPRMTAQNISLEPQRQALQRESNTARNVILRNSRNASSPSNIYANQIAGITGLTDSLGTQMGQSYMNEANQNAQYGQQAGMYNAQTGAQEALQNAQLQQQNAQLQGQYINSLSQTIPMAMRDYRQQANDAATLSMMGKDYGVYDKINPNETFKQRLARLMNTGERQIVNRNNPYIG